MKRFGIIIGTAAAALTIILGGGTAQAETNTQTDYYVVDNSGHQHGDEGFVYEYLHNAN